MDKIIYNAIRTPDGTVIQSQTRHDYQTYTDANGKEYMVDGGLEYLRRSAHGDEVDLSVSLDDGHEKVREVLTWGTFGPNGDLPLTYVKLCDMDTDHIKNLIFAADSKTPSRMHPHIRAAIQNELLWRGELPEQQTSAMESEDESNTKESLEDLLIPISEHYQKAREKYEAENDKWWNSLSEAEREHAFYAVVKRIHQGDVMDKGSYRYVLYDVFGFDPFMYASGMSCGYMDIHNLIGAGLYSKKD